MWKKNVCAEDKEQQSALLEFKMSADTKIQIKKLIHSWSGDFLKVSFF